MSLTFYRYLVEHLVILLFLVFIKWSLFLVFFKVFFPRRKTYLECFSLLEAHDVFWEGIHLHGKDVFRGCYYNYYYYHNCYHNCYYNYYYYCNYYCHCNYYYCILNYFRISNYIVLFIRAYIIHYLSWTKYFETFKSKNIFIF